MTRQAHAARTQRRLMIEGKQTMEVGGIPPAIRNQPVYTQVVDSGTPLTLADTLAPLESHATLWVSTETDSDQGSGPHPNIVRL